MEQALLIDKGQYWCGRFHAMASPCEVLMDTRNRTVAAELLALASEEALRIEHKFSRYRTDNIIARINRGGQTIEVDAETADLLDYAQSCYQLSGGLFDITSGVLREAWHFDGSDNIPTQQQLQQLLARIGWSKIQWQRPCITLPLDMQIDLGGIGKEYAADRIAAIMAKQNNARFSCLVNLGGDITVSATATEPKPWLVGIEKSLPGHNNSKHNTTNHNTLKVLLRRGAIATSGDARRYLLHRGRRYSHILNPKTGWPVAGAPRSITIHADTCIEAGTLSTLAMLQGEHAEDFLKAQEAVYSLQYEDREIVSRNWPVTLS